MVDRIEIRVSALEERVIRLQRLVRILVLALLALTLAVVLPAFLEVMGALLFVGLLAGLVFLARIVVDGQWQRLTGPARALYDALRAPRSA
ncbi:MAG: hypothetical protein ACI9EF_004009 [Pseudohongiellaceae bacterium]|jgi:hypothetical protein